MALGVGGRGVGVGGTGVGVDGREVGAAGETAHAEKTNDAMNATTRNLAWDAIGSPPAL